LSREDKFKEVKIPVPEKIYSYWVYKPKVNRKNQIPCSFCGEPIMAGEPYFEIALSGEDAERKTGHIQHLVKAEKVRYDTDKEMLVVGESQNDDYKLEGGKIDGNIIKQEVYSALHQAWLYRISTGKEVGVEVTFRISRELMDEIAKVNDRYKVKLVYK